MKAKKMLVYLEGDTWVANFIGDSEAMKHLGSTIVPTPFKSSVKEEIVVNKLRKLNPDYKIVTIPA